MKNQNKKKNKGFTLIEMLVSMTLFSFVITMALGALFMIMKANEKAKVIRIAVNNLNVALEGMSRELRMGSGYSITNNKKKISFKTHEGCDAGYKWNNGDKTLERAIARRTDPDNPSTCSPNSKSNLDYKKLTGENIQITDMEFIAVNTASGDGKQPKVFIYLKGEIDSAILGGEQPFYIQTMVSQRKIKS